MTTPTITRIESYRDSQGRIVLALYPVTGDLGGVPLFGVPTFEGQSQAVVEVPHPNGRSTMQQAVPFSFAIPDATSIVDAFAHFNAAQGPGWTKHLELMKAQALRQGADLSQLPQSRN